MDCCRIVGNFLGFTNTPTPNSTTPLAPSTSWIPNNNTTSSSGTIFEYTQRTRPFLTLFSDNVIKQGEKKTFDPSKEFVAGLMLGHIQIKPNHISTFAYKHSSALRAEGVKDEINELVTQWKTNDEFNHKKAETAIKEILGEGIKDEDVIFMLRMFCITKEEYSDFEGNYQDLMESLR